MTATTAVKLTRDLPTSYEWDTHESASNGPVWIAYIPESWEAPEAWKGTQQEWLESNGWDDFDSKEQWEGSGEASYPVMICPANDEPDGLYGWYYDSNPSYAFPREFVPMLLQMETDEALEWLRTRVTTRRKSWGMPWYIHSSGDKETA